MDKVATYLEQIKCITQHKKYVLLAKYCTIIIERVTLIVRL